MKLVAFWLAWSWLGKFEFWIENSTLSEFNFFNWNSCVKKTFSTKWSIICSMKFRGQIVISRNRPRICPYEESWIGNWVVHSSCRRSIPRAIFRKSTQNRVNKRSICSWNIVKRTKVAYLSPGNSFIAETRERNKQAQQIVAI